MDTDEKVELLRKERACDIRRPARVGECDSHGHSWYCFSCETLTKDHRSFDSGDAMLSHLRDVHHINLHPRIDSFDHLHGF